MPVMEKRGIVSPQEVVSLPEDTVSTARRAKAINAVRKMQETSAFRGNDKMTLDDINTVIADVRRSNTQTGMM